MSVVKMLLELKNANVVKTHSSAPLLCSSLLLEKEGKQYLFLANHSAKEIEIELPFGIKYTRQVQVYPSSLIETKAEIANRLKLGAYEVSCINA